MRWKDFSAQEDCSGCPILKAGICPGGVTCYGGAPVEPPCYGFNDDTELEEWVREFFAYQNECEEREDRLLREKKRKQERAQKAAETRRKVRDYCRDEAARLKRAKQALRSQLAAEQLASSIAEAFNFANEMLREKERFSVRPEISQERARLEAEVRTAEKAYEEKRQEFYKSRKKEGCYHGG